MRTFVYGIADFGKGPIMNDLDRESTRGVPPKKGGVQVVSRGRGRSYSWLLGRCQIEKEGFNLCNGNACCMGAGNELVGGCRVCARRARGGNRRGRARYGGGVGVWAIPVGCTDI